MSDSVDYSDSVSSVLAALGDPDGPLGSGPAVCLTLSLAVECLALQLGVTMAKLPPGEDAVELVALQEQLDGWRDRTRRAFVEDPAHFAEVLAARRLRDRAPGNERALHVERELQHLQRANDVLLQMLDVSLRLSDAADALTRGRGAPSVRAEGATSGILARAARDALATMLSSNLTAAQQRTAAYGLEIGGVARVREVAGRLPGGPLREEIELLTGG